MNEQLLEKLEAKGRVMDSLERDLNDTRIKLSQRKTSMEKTISGRDPESIEVKSAKVKDAVMMEPDMEPKKPSDQGIIAYHIKME